MTFVPPIDRTLHPSQELFPDPQRGTSLFWVFFLDLSYLEILTIRWSSPALFAPSHTCLCQLCPNSEKLVPSIPARNYRAIGLRKHYAKSESGTNLVIYDVYWRSMMMLFTGSKCLEYISCIMIMQNDNINRTYKIDSKWILTNAQIMCNTRYDRQNVLGCIVILGYSFQTRG